MLVEGEYHHCHNKKGLSRKFFTRNNMNPEEVPKELKGLI